MRARKLICLLFVVLICIAAIAISQKTSVSAQPAQDGIIIEAAGGFNGVAKLGAWTPVAVRICSQNRDISGEIEIEVMLEQARRAIFSKPVNLTAGVEQEIYIEIPVATANRELKISLTEKGKVRAETTYTFKRLLPPEIMLIGVLSEDSEAFNWLNGYTVPFAVNSDMEEKLKLMIAAGELSPSAAEYTKEDENYVQRYEAVVVHLDRNSFPDNSKIMENFDFIIISKYDTSLLSDAQVTVLEEWVESGGLLIEGTGLSWQKVYHGLPESLKPFSVTGTEDVQASDMLEKFIRRIVENVSLKLAKGELGFEYTPVNNDAGEESENQYLYYGDNYIIAGNHDNPLAIRYKKGNGTIVVLTFDPTAEPFASWYYRVLFMENTFKYSNANIQNRIYENGYYGKYSGANSKVQNIRDIAIDFPFDKTAPFRYMFIVLGVYLILVGPVLYIVLKIKDKRDLAWVLIPALSIVFLLGMYIFGFKTRYLTAIAHTVSLIEMSPGLNDAQVSSAIGIFNNEDGTITIEYDNDSGIQLPFFENNNYYDWRSGSGVIAKYRESDRIKFEQYDVPLWTTSMLYAQQTIQLNGGVSDNITLKDGRLKGTIENSTPYDLLDTVIVIGNNIVRVGDIVAWDSADVDIPLDGKDVYKDPEEYLDAIYGRTYYNDTNEYPDNFVELIQRRRLIEEYLGQVYMNRKGSGAFTLLAMNRQEMDYDLTVNGKKPQKYSKNLIVMESKLNFAPGQEIEIPTGVINPTMYHDGDIAWYGNYNNLVIGKEGDIIFDFVLPDNINVNEMRLSVKQYISSDIRYRMNSSSAKKAEIIPNRYEFCLYNAETNTWDEIKSDANEGFVFDTVIKDDVQKYIGQNNEVRLKISIVELAEDAYGYAADYYQEQIMMPEIYIMGVSK